MTWMGNGILATSSARTMGGSENGRKQRQSKKRKKSLAVS